jgi:acyl-CoA hydrolase
MTQIMQPTDANFLGKVFGGVILSQIDLMAYTVASKFSGEVCVTASFDQVDFHEPIDVGEIVTMNGFVSYVGRTSIEVTIEVIAEEVFRDKHRHTNTARVTMVAVRHGKPVEVPRLICQTREEKVRFLLGKLRRELRGHQRSEFERIGSTFSEASEAELDELLKLEKLSSV